ncbi:hypothetical protein [Flavobacterium sp. WV_118_3]|uniref:toxin-antitoxin system YwqK family antitoxin n=1 Tax=Flavobacterium sp. WV_118_3 TaxID=3151764 RepID=UPI00321A0B55
MSSILKKGVFIILFGIFSCAKNKENIIRKFSFNDGILSEYEYVIKDGDTILHGKVNLFDINGNEIGNGIYKNGKLNGEYITYFKNGKFREIRHYENDTIVGDRIYNFENGKIRKYIYHDKKGEVAFIVRFDEKGNVQSYEGHPLVDIEYFGVKDLNSLKIGDTLKYGYILANIPTAKSSLRIKLLDFDNSITLRRIDSKRRNTIKVQELVVKKGKNSIRAILKNEFNDSLKTSIVDSLRFDFLVEK